MEKELASTPLKVQNVTKVYPLKGGQRVVALDHVSLEIYAGEIFGLLGPNGAGKTTLINCVLGLIGFDQGNIHVFGWDVVKDYVRSRAQIGFVYQELALDNFFKPPLMLHFHRGMYGRPPDQVLVEKILKRLDLWPYCDKLPDQLSGGMKRRLAIAKALVHQPPLVILDEPTAGLDLEAREKMWEIIREIKKQGTAVLLTTHYLEEAEAISDRVGIINHGQFIKISSPQQLIEEMGKPTLEAVFRELVWGGRS